MSSKMQEILIVGGTSGLGEAFARQFQAMGKQVIVTGRRSERLSALEKELPGLFTRKWDITDLDNLQSHVDAILKDHPALDTVFLVAGIQKSFSFFDKNSSSDKDIVSEISSNVTAPMLLTRMFVPHLASIASTGKHASLLVTSSGLAFVPFGFYPVYCPTKAAIHSFCLTLRQQLNFAPEEVKKNLNIVEVVPPYVDTGLDQAHRENVKNMLGGEDKAFKPMPLDEYIQAAMAGLGEIDPKTNKMKKEVGVGSAQRGIDTWRGSLGKTLEAMGIDC